MDESALLIFTICLQAAIGALVFITIEKQFFNKENNFKLGILIVAILSVVGVAVSFLHLGTPLHAFNVLRGFGRSWLSDETIFAAAFTGVAVITALVQYFKPASQSVITALRWLGSIIGLITILFMAQTYASASVPAWDGANTFVDFYATAISTGAMVFLATSHKALSEAQKKFLPFIVLAVVVIQAAVAFPYAFNLAQNGMAAESSAQILQGLSVVIALKWIFVLGGAVLLLWPAAQKAGTTVAVNFGSRIYLAGAILIVGEIIGRYLFYAAMVISTIGLT